MREGTNTFTACSLEVIYIGANRTDPAVSPILKYPNHSLPSVSQIDLRTAHHSDQLPQRYQGLLHEAQ